MYLWLSGSIGDLHVTWSYRVRIFACISALGLHFSGFSRSFSFLCVFLLVFWWCGWQVQLIQFPISGQGRPINYYPVVVCWPILGAMLGTCRRVHMLLRTWHHIGGWVLSHVAGVEDVDACCLQMLFVCGCPLTCPDIPWEIAAVPPRLPLWFLIVWWTISRFVLTFVFWEKILK